MLRICGSDDNVRPSLDRITTSLCGHTPVTRSAIQPAMGAISTAQRVADVSDVTVNASFGLAAMPRNQASCARALDHENVGIVVHSVVEYGIDWPATAPSAPGAAATRGTATAAASGR